VPTALHNFYECWCFRLDFDSITLAVQGEHGASYAVCCSAVLDLPKVRQRSQHSYFS
jgi:hypothetical protein